MLEHILNNAMYTTSPHDEIYFTEDELWEMLNEIPDEPCDFEEDLDMDFIEKENDEFEDIIKNAPKEMI